MEYYLEVLFEGNGLGERFWSGVGGGKEGI